MNGQNGVSTMVARDFLIVGAGVIGLATALALRRLGSSVTIVDAATAGAGASWAGGGILSPLLPWEYPAPVVELTLHGAAMYEPWTEELHAECGIGSEYFRSGMRVMKPFDAPLATAWATATKVRIELDVCSSDAGAQLYLPDVAQVRNPRLLAALVASARARGVQVIEHTPVQSLVCEKGVIRGVRSEKGDIPAEAVVIAAGAWTPTLVPTCELSLKPIRGQMLLFGPTPPIPETILYCNGVYVIPRRDGHVLVGSTREDVGFDCGITTAARDELSKAAFALWPPLRQAPLLRQWAGLRPMRADNRPIIDRHPRYKNLFINAGHGRYGITMAPASAELLLQRMGLVASTGPLDHAFRIDSGAGLDKVQFVG